MRQGRLHHPHHETVEEYRKLKKGAQDNIKDVGGFVGGQLREGRRKNGMVLCRSMLTLDMDYGKLRSGRDRPAPRLSVLRLLHP